MPNDLPISLDTTDDDSLIYLLAFLSIPELLVVRQVSSTRTLLVSQHSTLWVDMQTIARHIKTSNSVV
jgi:hypothetical protein